MSGKKAVQASVMAIMKEIYYSYMNPYAKGP